MQAIYMPVKFHFFVTESGQVKNYSDFFVPNSGQMEACEVLKKWDVFLGLRRSFFIPRSK
jgi:hypothetical protein